MRCSSTARASSSSDAPSISGGHASENGSATSRFPVSRLSMRAHGSPATMRPPSSTTHDAANSYR